MNCRVEHIGEGVAHCVTDKGEAVRLAFAGTPFAALQEQLREGDELSVLDGYEHRGVLHPDLIVLAPRFLVDVTTLCSCHKSFGFNAVNGLLGKFEARTVSVPIQLGNLANDFFDECIHSPVEREGRKGQYMRVLQRSFRSNALVYTAMQGIDRDFFLKADQLHGYICDTVPALPSDLSLEPAFVCPDLGLQGRMDALSGDMRNIVELKSGKCDEWRRDSKCKPEHEMQMMLYREMLHYCTGIPRHEVQLRLFYCQYPLLERVEYTLQQMQKAMAVRNALVHQERLLRDGDGFMFRLEEGDFNTNGSCDKFYNSYFRPIISRFLQRLKTMDALTAAYFQAFTSFVEREQWLAKTAAYQGEKLDGLHLAPLKDDSGAVVAFDATLDAPSTDHDFRVGDMVVLFENARHQFFSCYITHLDACSLHLVLTYKQRDEQVFNLDSAYSITAGYMDAGFTAQYRGLAALAQADEGRRMALLHGTADCQLIVGPPGTGKTSRTLRDITIRHLEQGETLLLMAYTNQAVDEICSMLADVCPDFVRVGNENACAVQHRTRMMQNVVQRADNRSQTRDIVNSIRVFVGTVSALSACSELFVLRHFDLTVIDEASQVLEPQILPLLCRVGRFILIGDHKQLPAVVVQPRESCEVDNPLLKEIGMRSLADSYFERLLRLDALSGGHRTTMLCRQGRMHENLMAFVNRHFYGGRLTTASLPHQHAVSTQPRLQFFDIPYDGHSALKANPAEAAVVARIAQDVVQRYQPFDASRTLGVIVPFRAQIAAIRSAMIETGIPNATAITIDTVERYQGSQRDVIIFSTTITHPDQLDVISVTTDTEDGPVDRKLNVALTRARMEMIMTGCRKVLMRSSLYADWIENAELKR